ncbi:MAG: ABC transporter substrate-binding protein [Thermomicrobiales bacterium]|nr:ABC transporter substrate-binding protein [Thermomicrobiales bacterium]
MTITKGETMSYNQTGARRINGKSRVTRRRLLGHSTAAAGLGLLATQSRAFAATTGYLGGKAPTFRMQDGEKTAIVIGEADLETLKVDTWGSLLAYQAYRALYEPLVHYQTKAGPDGTMYYDPENLDFRSAESVEVVDGGKELRWKIRPGQTFENGRVIDATAWEQTFHWHFDRKGVGLAQAQVNGTLQSKDDVYADGDVLVMKFAEPNPWQISAFYILNQSVVDVEEIMKHATDDDPYGERWLEQNTVASGPYRLEKWVRGEQLVFRARPEYWAGKPDIDVLVFRIVPDASVRYQLLQKGEVDIASGISFKDLAALQDEPNVVTELWRTNNWHEIVMNWKSGPLGDVNVRRAIACAVPYDEIVDQAFYGLAERLKSPFGVHVAGADPDLWPYEYDLDRAREYLSQSDSPDGFTMPYYVASTNVIEEPIAVLLQDSLSQIGINLELQKMTGVQLSEALINKNAEMAEFSFYSWVPDAGYHILWNFMPDSFANFYSWENEAAQGIASEAIPMAEGDERNDLLKQFQQAFADDVASLPLVMLPESYPHKPNLSGFAYYPDSVIRWDKLTME